MFPPNAILFAGIVGFVAALVAGWIVYRRVYARRLALERDVREPARDELVPDPEARAKATGAERPRQSRRERHFSEDVGLP